MTTLAKTLPQEYVLEMQGLARASGVDFGEIVLFNVFYELFSACTSIIAQEDNGDLIHARNLDFGLFVGCVGVFTGVKPNAFSFSANERFSLDGGFVGIIEWIMGKHTAQWLGFYSRDIFDKCDDYACAKKSMSDSEMVSPVYFIVADG